MDISGLLEEKISEQFNIVPEMRFVPEFDPDGAYAGIRAFTFENISFEGKRTKAFGYIGFPEGADADRPVPAMLLIHGGLGHAYACWVKQWTDRGFAALAFDTTGFMPLVKNAGDREGDGDNERWTHSLPDVFAEDGFVPAPNNSDMKDIDRPFEDQWMFHALCGAIRAHNLLRNQSCIDRNRIGVTGISWGGVITSLLIGFDLRFSFAIPVYGSGYLGSGFGGVCELFKKPSVRNLWLAEKRFDRIRMPVFWIAWNEDTPFSVHSPSLSYQHVAPQCAGTRICLKHNMLHSHAMGWAPPEICAFAKAQLGELPAFPQLSMTREDRNIQVTASCEEGVNATGAMLYYLPKEQTEGESWVRVPCEVSDTEFLAVLPPEASGFYIELSFEIQCKIFTVTTPFESL